MKKPKVNECVFCRKVSLISTDFKTYVCDDCYEKQQESKKKLAKYELEGILNEQLDHIKIVDTSKMGGF